VGRAAENQAQESDENGMFHKLVVSAGNH
jgi:hypothetical protein